MSEKLTTAGRVGSDLLDASCMQTDKHANRIYIYIERENSIHTHNYVQTYIYIHTYIYIAMHKRNTCIHKDDGSNTNTKVM